MTGQEDNVSGPVPSIPTAAPPTLAYAAATRRRREPLWQLAPRRCAYLAAAWAVAVVALFLPGCRGGSGGGGQAGGSQAGGSQAGGSQAGGSQGSIPTFWVYSFTVGGAADGDTLFRDANFHVDVTTARVACALFPVGSAVFVFSPLLLRRRVSGRFGWLAWTFGPLLLAPWVLLAVFAYAGWIANFLYGYYLLALAHTLALAVIVWPRRGGPWKAAGMTSQGVR